MTPRKGVHPMKHAVRFLLIVALAAATPSVPLAAHARSEAARSAAQSVVGPGAPAEQSWLGKASGYLCREGFRYIGTPAFPAWGGFCLLALLYAID